MSYKLITFIFPIKIIINGIDVYVDQFYDYRQLLEVMRNRRMKEETNRIEKKN